MPKQFPDRQAVHRALLESGRELFSTYGLKKTTVDEIVRKAGVAKGTFYAFFPSKEQLFFEIMLEEEQIRERLVKQQYLHAETARDGIRGLIREGLREVAANPILSQLYREGTYEILMRKIDPEKIREHARKDEEETRGFITSLQREGLLTDEPPEVITGLLRALFLLTLHTREIGEDLFPRVMDLLSRITADGLTTEEGKQR